MKVTIDIRMLDASGIGTYIRQVVPRVMKLRPDWRFHLLGDPSRAGEWEGARLPNATVVECLAPIYSLSEQLQLPSRIPKDTDLYWHPHYNIPLFYKGKMLVTVHDAFHLAMPQFTGGLHKRLYARYMFDAVARKAKAILCISEFTRMELEKFTGKGAEKTRVTHLGADLSWFGSAKAPRPHPRPYLLYVGNIKPHKNLGRLLQAFESVQSQIPQDLVLVGQKEGFLTGDPAVLARAERSKDRVHFTGRVDDAKLKDYYQNAEALVFPSLYEGFGLPPLEAMACGCPVLASKAASIPEVCADAASYFDPFKPEEMADRILEILRNSSLREQLRKKGFERARGFSWDKCAAGTIEAIEGMMV